MLLVTVSIRVVLGSSVETPSLTVATIPIVAPLVVGPGHDPVWFGILTIAPIEMAPIAPPVGPNLRVVQGARGSGRLSEVMAGAVPDALTLLAMAGALIAAPDLAPWLPRTLTPRPFDPGRGGPARLDVPPSDPVHVRAPHAPRRPNATGAPWPSDPRGPIAARCDHDGTRGADRIAEETGPRRHRARPPPSSAPPRGVDRRPSRTDRAAGPGGTRPQAPPARSATAEREPCRPARPNPGAAGGPARPRGDRPSPGRSPARPRRRTRLRRSEDRACAKPTARRAGSRAACRCRATPRAPRADRGRPG